MAADHSDRRGPIHYSGLKGSVLVTKGGSTSLSRLQVEAIQKGVSAPIPAHWQGGKTAK
jgi:hypothetical protein